MDSKSKLKLDNVDWQLLEALQEDARLSYTELGRRVGLTSPAVTERLRRLEESGIIRGYRAELDTAKLGAPVKAFIRLTTSAPRYPAVIKLLESMPEVLECHHLTGEASFLIQVAVASVGHIEKLIEQLSPYGETQTSVALSSPLGKRGIRSPRNNSQE